MNRPQPDFLSRPKSLSEAMDEPREAELELSDQVQSALPMATEAAPSLALGTLPPGTLPPGSIRDLFSSIEIRPGPDGRVTFEAPAEAAAALAAMFEGMAKLFSARG